MSESRALHIEQVSDDVRWCVYPEYETLFVVQRQVRAGRHWHVSGPWCGRRQTLAGAIAAMQWGMAIEREHGITGRWPGSAYWREHRDRG